MRGSRLTAVILCGLVGTLGGALILVVGQASVVTGVLLGGLYGVLFALFVARGWSGASATRSSSG
jgi:hypothetical protein